MIVYVGRMYRYLRGHPLTQDAPFRALRRVIAWQLTARLCPFDLLMPWVNGTRLVMRRGMTGATGNWYTGLHEYQDMSFVLHLLRPEDLFFDVGANVGAFTVLASGAVGAETLAVEPGDTARSVLQANIAVNLISDRVSVTHEGIAAADGVAYFTTGLDTVNHLADGPGPGIVEIPVRSLSSLAAGRAPLAIKVDVEGAEFDALTGAAELLKNGDLKALILELNDNVLASGHSRAEIFDLLAAEGFTAHGYDPANRRLTEPGEITSENVIFVRDHAFVEARLQTAPGFEVFGHRL